MNKKSIPLYFPFSSAVKRQPHFNFSHFFQLTAGMLNNTILQVRLAKLLWIFAALLLAVSDEA